MFHTSPALITDINKFGIAGDCLFFSDDAYSLNSDMDSLNVYEADFDCIAANQLHDEDIISEIAEMFDVDVETAEGLLDASESEWDLEEMDADKSWWLQGKRGECAKKMGYDGCEDEDEQGTVYIIPMTGKLDKLTLVK